MGGGVDMDDELKLLLRDLPRDFENRYTEEASSQLLKVLFYALSNGNSRLLAKYFFPGGISKDTERWVLSVAQGAVDGAEYTEAARGKPCGHVFRDGEATYTCKTCTADDTCVLCARCFEASDHDGHNVSISVSHGMSGCCDCGDPEAWIRPMNCSIHTALPAGRSSNENEASAKTIPEELTRSIRTTISRAFDYVLDVFSCSPEQMRTPTSEEDIREHEVKSRLSHWYGSTTKSEQDDEFALVLWNDEKHTMIEVKEQVARACRKTRSYGEQRAREVDDVGRSIVEYSKNIQELIEKAKILAQIRVTVTIRSARDIFREQMCETIIEWLADIAGCSVGDDHHILMNVICEEMLQRWRIGSTAFNLGIGQGGLIDHEKSDNRLRRQQERVLRNRVRIFQEQAHRLEREARQRAQAAAQRAAQPADTRQDQIGMEPVVDEVLEDDEEDDEDDEDDEGDDENEEDDEDEDEDDLGEDILDDEADAMDLDELDEELVLVPGGPGTVDEVRVDAREILVEMAASREDEDDLTPTPPDRSGDNPVGESFTAQTDPNKLYTSIPRTPRQAAPERTTAPSYWIFGQLSKDATESQRPLPPYEDMTQRVRIDHLVFYDMRMWKNLRDKLRHFYISTVVTVPSFKRILSLRFAVLYTHLAQLYLLSDREAEHSIIYLSLQMLTTPSVTEEVVRRSNFFTRLLAILYTFLTKKQVGEPEEVDPEASVAFETGTMANRRMGHLFSDLKYLLDIKFVRQAVRTQHEYLQQFLDFAKLFQGICPNVRALYEHVEYESDNWIAASILVKDVTRLCRQFADCFHWNTGEDPAAICRAIRQTAKVVIIHSMGAESARFPESEITKPVKFKTLATFQFEEMIMPQDSREHMVVDCVVEKSPMSFHHALHYMLSWLINSGKSMSATQLQNLLDFNHYSLQPRDSRLSGKLELADCRAEQYQLAVFDIPLRVCVWLAQMRAGMWVRNGMGLRHQMGSFRSVGQREVSYQRDLFMLQTAFVVCDSSTFLASVIERFGMTNWVRGNYQINEGHEDAQMVEVAEDFIHTLIVLLSDRTLLLPPDQNPDPKAAIAKRDIIHVLCFKPLSYSDLTSRLSERLPDTDGFNNLLEELASYRPPEGLADSGTLVLNEDFYFDIDPYQIYYNKSQREEAENIHRSHKAKRLGKTFEEVFYEPKFGPVRSGVFENIGHFSQEPLFAQVVHGCLRYVLEAAEATPNVTAARIEAFLQVILHLILVAVHEDQLRSKDTGIEPAWSFLTWAFETSVPSGPQNVHLTIVGQLFTLLTENKYQGSKLRIRFVLDRLRFARPHKYERLTNEHPMGETWRQHASTPEPDSSAEQSLKKKQALARQAKVMESFKKQQNEFMENQNIDWGIDDMSDLEEDDPVVEQSIEEKVWEVPRGNCILCQAESGDKELFGTLAYMTESTLFRQTDVEDADYLDEVVKTPLDLDRSADSIRPFGVAGRNVEHVTKVGVDGSQVDTEVRTLGKGFPVNHQRSGPMVNGCGHIMHWACFQEYSDATMRRHRQQSTRNHPEVDFRNEFVCPLCKALGNSFMPIVWKPRPRVSPAETHPSPHIFDDWVASKVPTLMSTNRGLPLSQQAFARYASERLIPEVRPLSSANHPSSATNMRHDLTICYTRVLQTLARNRFATKLRGGPVSEEISRTDTLSDMLGFSLAAVEIAQRGVGSSGAVFVDSIPQQTMNQLRVFSETVSSYVSLCATMPNSRMLSDVQDCAQLHFKILFGHDYQFVAHDSDVHTPLFSQEIFVFLTGCAVFLDPLEISSLHHLVRLCYLAEIIKVVITVIRSPEVVEATATADSSTTPVCSQEQSQNFSAFVQGIIQQYQQSAAAIPSDPSGFLSLRVKDNPNQRFSFDQYLRRMVNSYALVFLRKCALLVHVRYGIDYSASSNSLDSSTNELGRLEAALGLPTIDEIVASFIASSPSGEAQQHLAASWIRDWQSRYTQTTIIGQHGLTLSVGASAAKIKQIFAIRLSHPGIYELVSLPYNHDTLNVIAMSRRCPTTGRGLTDPNVCLFCGAVFCGQAACCSQKHNDRSQGGCYLHMKGCGKNIGMFLNIRKCAVLFLHRDNGSFFTPPYLDKHGEVDMGMRRRQQLFLNQKRYDRLFREVWLGANGGVPSAVARKLESDINTGGWETL